MNRVEYACENAMHSDCSMIYEKYLMNPADFLDLASERKLTRTLSQSIVLVGTQNEYKS